MKLQRNTTTKIAYILDNWIPPAIRDSKWFMWCAFHLLFKDKAHYFYTFKDKAFSMSHKEFSNVYETLSGVHIERETDLNHACIDKILANLIKRYFLVFLNLLFFFYRRCLNERI